MKARSKLVSGLVMSVGFLVSAQLATAQSIQDSIKAMTQYTACTQSLNGASAKGLAQCNTAYKALMDVVQNTQNKGNVNFLVENSVIASYFALQHQKKIDALQNFQNILSGSSARSAGPSKKACALAGQGLDTNFQLKTLSNSDNTTLQLAKKGLFATHHKCRAQEILTSTPPKQTDEQRIKANLDTCFANPSKDSLDLNISACETVHAHFRIKGDQESRKIKAMAESQRTSSAYINHDNYYYRGGAAAFQMAKFQNLKTPNDQKALCPYLHKAMRQFKTIHAPPARGGPSWKIIATTKNLLDACKAKGF